MANEAHSNDLADYVTDDEIYVQTGLKLFNSKKYSDAVIEWHKALQSKTYGTSPEVYFNLGLTEFHLKDYGASLAHLRKAQDLNPLSLKIYKTIGYVTKHIQEKEFYRIKNSPYLTMLITWIPKTLWITIFIVLIGFGTLAGSRHVAHGISVKDFFKTYAGFLILSLLPLFMIYKQSTLDSAVFATLVGSTPLPLYTHPNSEAPELGLINVGDAFEIIKTHAPTSEISADGWVAVTTPETPFGWLNSKNFIVHEGKIDPPQSSN